MSNIIIKIKRIKTEEGSERIIAEYILDNLSKIENIDIRELAKRTYSSPSAISRFVKKLGFKGFVEFKYELSKYNDKDFKDKLSVSYLEKPNEIFDKIKNLLEVNKDIIAQNDFEGFAKVIDRSKKVNIFANGGTFTIAYDLSLKMQRLGFNAMAVNDSIIQQALASVPENKENSVYIIISSTGETKNLVEVAKYLKDNEKTLLSITENSENRIKRLSNINLSFNPYDDEISSLISGNRIVLWIVVEILVSVIIEKNKIGIDKIIKTVK